MICDLNDINNINNIIKSEKLDILVISYGGCCTNILVNYLEKNNFKCNTKIWLTILCHCPQYIECDIPIIYIYDNPIKSFMSMKKRGKGFWDVNQKKLSNNNDVVLSDENLLQLIIKQFNSFKNKKNVLMIKSSELFENDIVNKLEFFLNKKIEHFPVEYKTPTNNILNINNIKLVELFEKYKLEIDKINNYNEK